MPVSGDRRVSPLSLELDSGFWRAACGWKFGRSGVRRLAAAPGAGRRMCKKCLPGEHALLAAEVVAVARVG
eukprot:1285673-Amphidinium_carterae.1